MKPNICLLFAFALWEPHVKDIQAILSRARQTPEDSYSRLKIGPQINLKKACRTHLDRITAARESELLSFRAVVID